MSQTRDAPPIPTSRIPPTRATSSLASLSWLAKRTTQPDAPVVDTNRFSSLASGDEAARLVASANKTAAVPLVSPVAVEAKSPISTQQVPATQQEDDEYENFIWADDQSGAERASQGNSLETQTPKPPGHCAAGMADSILSAAAVHESSPSESSSAPHVRSQSASRGAGMATAAAGAATERCPLRHTWSIAASGAYTQSWPGLLPTRRKELNEALLARAQRAIDGDDIASLKQVCRELSNEVQHLGIRLQRGKLMATLDPPNTLFGVISKVLGVSPQVLRRACSDIVRNNSHFEGQLWRFEKGKKVEYTVAQYAAAVVEEGWVASRMDLHVLAHTALLKRKIIVMASQRGGVRCAHFTPADSNLADAQCLWMVSCSHGRWASIKLGSDYTFTPEPVHVEASVSAALDYFKRLRDDPLEEAVSRYCVALSQQSLQGSLAFVMLLQRSGQLPCPVVILQRETKGGKAVLLKAATVPEVSSATERVYLAYTKGPDGAGSGHYNLFAIKREASSPPRHRLSDDEATSEGLETAAVGGTSAKGVCLLPISGERGQCLFRCLMAAFELSTETQISVASSEACKLLQLVSPDERATWADTLMDGLRVPKSKASLPSATLLNVPVTASFPTEWDVASTKRSGAQTILTVATNDALQLLLSSSNRKERGWFTVDEAKAKAKVTAERGKPVTPAVGMVALYGAPRRLTLERLKQRVGWQGAVQLVSHPAPNGHFHQVTVPAEEAEKLLANSPSGGWRVADWKKRGAASKAASSAIKRMAAAQVASTLSVVQRSSNATATVQVRPKATRAAASTASPSGDQTNVGTGAAATPPSPSTSIDREDRDKEILKAIQELRADMAQLKAQQKSSLPSQQEEQQGQQETSSGDGRPPYSYGPPPRLFAPADLPSPFPPASQQHWYPPFMPYDGAQHRNQRSNQGPRMRVDHFLRGGNQHQWQQPQQQQQQHWSWADGGGYPAYPAGPGWFGPAPGYGPQPPYGSAGASAGVPPRC